MLPTSNTLRIAAMSLILSCGAAVAPHASAGHDDDRRDVYIERSTRGGSVRVQVNTGRHDDRYDQRRYNDRHDNRRYDRGHPHHPPVTCPPPPPAGYWKTVYHPPVYRTVYDCYGRPQCIMVRAGHYDRVWVAYDNHRGHIH